ncbi:MAG: S1 RNA-binding domain-containing protein, partial [bacterium]
MEENPSNPSTPAVEADEAEADEAEASPFAALSDDQDPDALTQEQMEDIYAATIDPVKDGEIVKGSVVRLEGDYVLIDVGFKSEGSVSRHEFTRGGQDLKPGDAVEVYVEAREDEDGLMVLSKEK